MSGPGSRSVRPMQEEEASPIDDVAVEALQRALASEHAALWAYSLALAFVPAEWATRARADIEAHKSLRAEVTTTLSDLGKRPVSAQPAYTPPQPVVDAVSAGALMVAAETDTTAAWRSVLERSSYQPLRAAGLKSMIACTGRCAYWRGVTDRSPAIPVFPGRS